MKSLIRISLIITGLSFLPLSVYSQCEILNRIAPDGSMQYFMEPVNFYWTSAKSLRGCIVTDKENYFLELLPLPFPEKPAGKKLRSDLKIKLSDGKFYELEHFDTRYIAEDTVMEMLFLIKKEDIDNLLRSDVEATDIDMMGEEGVRTYQFKLHKSALKEQLNCFLNEQKNKKEEKRKKD
jgi:hypothetical protein